MFSGEYDASGFLPNLRAPPRRIGRTSWQPFKALRFVMLLRQATQAAASLVCDPTSLVSTWKGPGLEGFGWRYDYLLVPKTSSHSVVISGSGISHGGTRPTATSICRIAPKAATLLYVVVSRYWSQYHNVPWPRRITALKNLQIPMTS